MNWRWRIAKAGMTQKQFAKHLGVAPSQISDWVNMRKEATPLSVIRVDTALQEFGV